MGLNGMTIEQELDMDIKKVQHFATINEVREKYEMKPLDDGDIIESTVYMQARNAAAGLGMPGQGNPNQPQSGVPTPDGEEEQAQEQNPFDLYAEGDEEETEDGDDTEKAENSFVKAFDSFMEQELNK